MEYRVLAKMVSILAFKTEVQNKHSSTVHPISSKAEIWCVYFLSLLPAGRLVLVSILPSAGSLLLNSLTKNLYFRADGIRCRHSYFRRSTGQFYLSRTE